MHADGDGKVTARVRLAFGERRLEIEMRLPARPTRPGELLPLYRGLAEQVVQAGVDDAAEAGRSVSCSKGCGACCRQLVPVSELEARSIRDVVAAMPESRRALIRERFAAARQQLAEAGLLRPLLHPGDLTPQEAAAFGLRYLGLGIPCPFLEEEACSIYQERPIACREYLVTSPPANCSHPSPEAIATVKLPGSVSRAIRWLTAPEGAERAAWVPLILALEWAEAHPEPAPARTGPELAQELFRRLSSSP